MQQMAQKGGLSSDRKIVVYIFDDVVEFGGEEVQRDLMPQIFPSFLSSTKPEEEASLRQGCAYGIGVCATQGGQHFVPYVSHAAKALVECISHPEASGPANSAATDNCISSLGKVCSYHAGVLRKDPKCSRRSITDATAPQKVMRWLSLGFAIQTAGGGRPC